MRYRALLEVGAVFVRASCRKLSWLRVGSVTGLLILLLGFPCLFFAQSGPVLSYSTYLPKINVVSTAVGPTFPAFPPNGFSVNSQGAACVTDGMSLYGYDANGNVTFTVADVVSVAPKIRPTTVFRDQQGNCFVAGGASFFTPMGQTPLAVARFSSTGSLGYVVYFSGNTGANGSTPSQIVADSLGNAYVIGNTDVPDFPLRHPIQNLLNGAQDAFVLKLDSNGAEVYSTYFGTNNNGFGIAVDAGGNAYITGDIGRVPGGGSIPVTQGVFQSAPKSAEDAWVAKIDPSGNQIYGTYLGGSANDSGLGVAADTGGNAYVVGATCSTDFPTKNAFQPTLAANCSGLNVNQELSGFVSKISPDGSALVYSTFLGGSDGAQATAIAVDSSGAAYVTGTSAGANFPLLNPIQFDFLDTTPTWPVGQPISQAFVTVFNNTASALQYSSFFGGFSPDIPGGIGVDTSHNVYLGGGDFANLNSSNAIQSFPILAASNGLFQPFFQLCFHSHCGFQGFVAKISPTTGTALASPAIVDFGTILKGHSSFPVPVLIANVGSTNIQINSTSITGGYSISNNTCTGALLSAKHCEVDVIFGPTAGGTRTGVLTLNSNAPDSPRNIQLTGIGGVPIVSLNPTSLNLTSPSIGTSGPTKTVVLSNTGADTLNITSLSITGPNAADFSETHDCASTLNPGSSCNVNITYKASTSNTETASLQFVDNASGSPRTVPLTGTISAFGLTLAPGSPSSATVSAGQMATYNLMIGGPGFSGNVTLSCTGAPTAATCSVPGSESLSSTPTAFQAAVTTTARSTAMKLLPRINFPAAPVAVIVVFGVLVMVLLTSRRRRVLIALALVSLDVVLMASCGGGGGGGGGAGATGTPSGTFTIVVTATNGTSNQSINLTLNVN